MAAIDIKDATIYLIDGTSVGTAGAVNNSSGYAAHATTILVDGFSAVIPVGMGFKIGTTVPTVYKVVSVVGGSTPTSLTFSPGLTAAVVDNAVVTLVGNVLEITVGEGNLTYNEKRAITYVKDRGRLDTVKLGDEDPVEVSLEFTWEFLASGSGDLPTVEEVLKHSGNAASWTSSASDTCEPYAVDIFILYEPPCGSEYETITLPDFRYESLDHDLRQSRVSVKGTSNATVATVAHFG